jgi:hypothetical protein
MYGMEMWWIELDDVRLLRGLAVKMDVVVEVFGEQTEHRWSLYETRSGFKAPANQPCAPALFHSLQTKARVELFAALCTSSPSFNYFRDTTARVQVTFTTPVPKHCVLLLLSTVQLFS